MIALPLLANVAQRIFRAAFVVLVQHNQIGEVQHVYLFELAGRAVIAGHDVDGKIDEIDNLTIALADAGRLHDDQIEVQRFQEQHLVGEHFAGCKVLATRRDGTHVDPFRSQGVHADSVTEQRTTGAPARRVDGNDGNPLVREAGKHAVQDFIGDAALARTTGAGNADDGNGFRPHPPFLAQCGELRVTE